MIIKNTDEMINTIKEEIISACLVPNDNFKTWYATPEGEWYSDEEPDGNTVPEDYWNGTDVFVYCVNEQQFSDGVDIIENICVEEGTSSQKIYDLYIRGKLDESYPEYDWDEIFENILASYIKEVEKGIEIAEDELNARTNSVHISSY